MYKLVYFRATNIIGFLSGLGKKTFELDLTSYFEKDIICIVGDNACGKSTLLSLIHPWHIPTDKRLHFVVDGKEGTIVRRYLSEDGTMITSTCIYTPKGEDKHNAKCYLTIEDKNGHSKELNPNGNVSSYYAKVDTYMGLTKDYLNFASYNDAVSGIVKMTDSERKENINMLIPNTARFESAYFKVNDKYKELRALIHNLSQKITELRDKESLEADYKRLDREIHEYQQERESYIKELTLLENKIKELLNGNDINEVIRFYKQLSYDISSCNDAVEKLTKELHKIYYELSIDHKSTEEIEKRIIHFEKEIARLESEYKISTDRYHAIATSIGEFEKRIDENKSTLYALQTKDIHELERSKTEYLAQMEEMRYHKVQEQYKDMDYNTAIALSKNIAILDHMIQALYDEYGQMISDYFIHQENFNTTQLLEERKTLQASIETKTAKRDELYRTMIEKEQYRKFQSILDQRPVTCKIDSCPFIANALKWEHVADDIEQLKKQYETMHIDIQTKTESLDDVTKKLSIREDIGSLLNFIQGNEAALLQYLNVTRESLLKSIANGTWTTTLDILKLRDMAAILSEKELYIKIKTVYLPDIEHGIELAKLYGTNRQLIQQQIDQDQEQIAHLQKEYSIISIRRGICKKSINTYTERLGYWNRLKYCLSEYEEKKKQQEGLNEQYKQGEESIQTIRMSVDRKEEIQQRLAIIDRLIAERVPQKEQINIEIANLKQMQLEKETIDKDFTIVNIMRSIVQPGKGIRKELLNIYMYDIYHMANTLLLNTFNGNLYLKEFIITDKEFIIPYVYNGSEGDDISYASSSQQTTISIAISLAILSKTIDRYGIFTGDEMDAPLSRSNKEVFVDILATQMKTIGLHQVFMITHSPEIYEQYDVGFIQFPGVNLDNGNHDVIKIK